MMNSFQNSLAFVSTNPWIYLFTSKIMLAYGAGFTSPGSFQRTATFIILCLHTCLTLTHFTSFIDSTSFLAQIIGGSIAILPVTYFDRLILRKWAFEDRKAIFATNYENQIEGAGRKMKERTPAPTEQDHSIGSRFAFGNKVGGTGRGLGTSWQVQSISHFSQSDPDWIPSLLNFIVWKSAIIIGCYFVHHYVFDLRVNLGRDDFHPSRIPFFTRIRDVTPEEIWMRVLLNVTFWITGYCILQPLFSIPAVIAVCFNPKSVGEWRPPFGSIQDAYTIRQFWRWVSMLLKFPVFRSAS